jgi:hypothetical protein
MRLGGAGFGSLATAFGWLARAAAGRSASAVAPTRRELRVRARRAPARSRASVRSCTTAPRAIARRARCGPADAASPSPGRAARVLKDAAHVRGRARFCCVAPAHWRVWRPSADFRAPQTGRGGGRAARGRQASAARRSRSDAAPHALPARAAPAASAARWIAQNAGNARGYWLLTRGAGRRSHHPAAAAGSPATRRPPAGRGPRRAIRCGGCPGRAASTASCGADSRRPQRTIRRVPAPPFPPPPSASARACRRRNRSA